MGALHYEIEGMREVEGASLALALAVLADGATQVKHLREAEVLSIAATLVDEDPARITDLSEEWRRSLAEWKPAR
jgi:hypothetical protein